MAKGKPGTGGFTDYKSEKERAKAQERKAKRPKGPAEETDVRRMDASGKILFSQQIPVDQMPVWYFEWREAVLEKVCTSFMEGAEFVWALNILDTSPTYNYDIGMYVDALMTDFKAAYENQTLRLGFYENIIQTGAHVDGVVGVRHR